MHDESYVVGPLQVERPCDRLVLPCADTIGITGDVSYSFTPDAWQPPLPSVVVHRLPRLVLSFSSVLRPLAPIGPPVERPTTGHEIDRSGVQCAQQFRVQRTGSSIVPTIGAHNPRAEHAEIC